MKIKFITILIIQLLFLSCVFAQSDQKKDKKQEQDDAPSLSNLKNPFTSLLPKKPVVLPPIVINPVTNVPVKPVEPKAPVINAKTLDLKLFGMVWGEAKPQALINDKLVGIGDVVNGAKVTSISKKGVVLYYNEVRIKLTVND